jgi:uncharacterized protein YaeQ
MIANITRREGGARSVIEPGILSRDPGMALTATIHHVQIALSDVDRGVYEALDLRLARHPSESMRYLVTRMLAYCLSFEAGIAFSKGGLSSAEEAPISVRDPTGILLAWIDVGAPSVERMHKASKSARRVAVFTHQDLAALRKDAGSIHKAASIEVFRFDSAFLEAVEAHVDRNTKLELVRTDDQLYVTVAGKNIEGELVRSFLA